MYSRGTPLLDRPVSRIYECLWLDEGIVNSMNGVGGGQAT